MSKMHDLLEDLIESKSQYLGLSIKTHSKQKILCSKMWSMAFSRQWRREILSFSPRSELQKPSSIIKSKKQTNLLQFNCDKSKFSHSAEVISGNNLRKVL